MKMADIVTSLSPLYSFRYSGGCVEVEDNLDIVFYDGLNVQLTLAVIANEL